MEPSKNDKAVFEYQHNLMKFSLDPYYNSNSLFYSPIMKDIIIQVVWNVTSIVSCNTHQVTFHSLSSDYQASDTIFRQNVQTIVLANIIWTFTHSL